MNRTETYFEVERLVSDEGGIIALGKPFVWGGHEIAAVANFEECGHGRLAALEKNFDNWDIEDCFSDEEFVSLAHAIRMLERYGADFSPNSLAEDEFDKGYCLQIATLFFAGGAVTLRDHISERGMSPFEESLKIAYAVSEMFHKEYARTVFDNGTVEEYLSYYVCENKDAIEKALREECCGISERGVEGFLSFCKAIY